MQFKLKLYLEVRGWVVDTGVVGVRRRLAEIYWIRCRGAGATVGVVVGEMSRHCSGLRAPAKRDLPLPYSFDLV